MNLKKSIKKLLKRDGFKFNQIQSAYMHLYPNPLDGPINIPIKSIDVLVELKDGYTESELKLFKNKLEELEYIEPCYSYPGELVYSNIKKSLNGIILLKSGWWYERVFVTPDFKTFGEDWRLFRKPYITMNNIVTVENPDDIKIIVLPKY